MFYANNEQVKGIFLNGRNYNYLAYGFGKIIPEDRNSVQLNLNLAYKCLNHYRIEWGTVKDGWENALVSPRVDEPDYNGIFHTPFTYYYNGSIIPTKQVSVLITDGKYALRNALVYSDMNINGAISYFASNTDFQGHNVKVFPERNNYQILLNDEMLNNCGNFDLNIETRFSKSGYPTLYNCNNFSGNFKYVGSADNKYPGFMGFLGDCKDGVFNIDCTNMHGGGSSANIRNYYNFSGIQSCSNIKLNINGSPWQAWVHSHCYSYNCNINTYNVISGFSYMNDCNFNMYLPSNANVEKSAYYSILSDSNNCNVHFDGISSNLHSFRNGNSTLFLFQDLNYCNLNLLLNKSTGLDYAFGNYLNNCNIVFDNIKADLSTFTGWDYLYNCNITGNVESVESKQGFIGRSDGLGVNINAAKSSRVLLMWRCNNVKGNLVAGDATFITYGNYLNLNVSNGNLNLSNIEHSILNFNGTNAYCNGLNNIYAGAYNTTFSCRNASDTNIYSEGGGTAITGADNCYNLKLSGLTFKTPDSDSLFENIYNSKLKFGTADPYYRLWHVESCIIDGFPRSFEYVNNCVFRPFNLRTVGLYGGGFGTWNNIWPHLTTAGIRSMGSISNCRIVATVWNTDGNRTFNKTNNMQTSFGNYYNGTVTANLPTYNMNIKLNVDCSTLNLGIFQAGPPHGFRNATISANNIYAKGDMPNAYVYVNCDTKIYCENYCNVCFIPYVSSFSAVLQPVVLINNYDHANNLNQSFRGGLTRIGRLNTRTGPSRFLLYAGACVFINNAVLNGAIVDNSLLFLGSNVSWDSGANVTNGGLIVSRKNYSMDAISKFVNRNNFAWNIWDSGPWGSQSLLNFCIDV